MIYVAVTYTRDLPDPNKPGDTKPLPAAPAEPTLPPVYVVENIPVAGVAAVAKAKHAPLYPSARVLATMGTDFDGSYLRFTRAQSVQTRNLLLGLPWSEAQQRSFEAMARDSVLEQKRIEASDTMPFEIYRQEYLAPQRLGI